MAKINSLEIENVKRVKLVTLEDEETAKANVPPTAQVMM